MTALLALDLVGIVVIIREENSTKLLDRVLVLTTGNPTKIALRRSFFVLMTPFFGCLLRPLKAVAFSQRQGDTTISLGVWL